MREDVLAREMWMLRKRLDDLARPEIGHLIATDNVSAPPTDAELDTAFPNAYEGFIGLVDDNGAGTTVWLVAYVNSGWWYEGLTAAV